METWFSDTSHIPFLEAEVCFLINDAFYFGPDTFEDLTANFEKYSEALGPPGIPRMVPSLVRTTEAFGNEAELVGYYEQVVRLARKHNQPFNSIRQYFWLRFRLWNTEEKTYLTFPWYDSFSEIDGFITALAAGNEGLVFHDGDQGWELEVYSHGGLLYFRQRDRDADEIQVKVSVSRENLLNQLGMLRERAIGIIGTLSDALGADVWSTYVRDEPSFR